MEGEKVEVGDEATASGLSDWDLDPLAVRDRFQLLAFTRRPDSLEYLWTLRAMEVLRAQHVAQPDVDRVARALATLAVDHPDAPREIAKLRERLDTLADQDHLLHRLDDPSRARSLARYRNRQSVYQFSELGYFAYTAIESVLGTRLQDVNLSRLAFSDILRDLKDLAEANRLARGDDIVRRLGALNRAVEDMARRSARFQLTLAEMLRSSDNDPDTFLSYKNALLTHMNDFMLELDRYLPQLNDAMQVVEATGLETLLMRASEFDERPFLRPSARLEDWRRHWRVLRAWFALDEIGGASQTAQLRTATRAGVSGLIALLRQITESRRGGVSRASELRHLANWVWEAPDQETAHAILAVAFNVRSARHPGGIYDQPEVVDPALSWWQAPGVEVSKSIFQSNKAPTAGLPQPLARNDGRRADLRRQQQQQRTTERQATGDLISTGVADVSLSEEQATVLLRLVGLALQTRSVVAGQITATGTSDTAILRLLPDKRGSQVRTPSGVLHLPGLRIEIDAATVKKAGANV